MPGTAVLGYPSIDQELVCVCCHCQRVRTETGEWEYRFVPEDEFVSHGICRACYQEFYPGYRLPASAR